EAYRKHAEERAAEGVPAKPLNEQQVAELVELLKNPPKGEEDFLVELFTIRIPPGVDQAPYVKAAVLADIAKGEAPSQLIDAKEAVRLLGTMQGGYNVEPLIAQLDNEEHAQVAADALKHTLLVFDAFHDVEEKAKAGNNYAKEILQSWADAEWFTER